MLPRLRLGVMVIVMCILLRAVSDLMTSAGGSGVNPQVQGRQGQVQQKAGRRGQVKQELGRIGASRAEARASRASPASKGAGGRPQ